MIFPDWAKRCVTCFPVQELTMPLLSELPLLIKPRRKQLKTAWNAASGGSNSTFFGLFFVYYLAPPGFCRCDTAIQSAFPKGDRWRAGWGRGAGLPSSKNRLLLTLSATEWWSVTISACTESTIVSAQRQLSCWMIRLARSWLWLPNLWLHFATEQPDILRALSYYSLLRIALSWQNKLSTLLDGSPRAPCLGVVLSKEKTRNLQGRACNFGKFWWFILFHQKPNCFHQDGFSCSSFLCAMHHRNTATSLSSFAYWSEKPEKAGSNKTQDPFSSLDLVETRLTFEATLAVVSCVLADPSFLSNCRTLQQCDVGCGGSKLSWSKPLKSKRGSLRFHRRSGLGLRNRNSAHYVW